MKRSELREAKQRERELIDGLRARILSRLTEKRPIPRDIVDGTFSQVIKFKQDCEAALKVYHVSAPPGQRKTLQQLCAIRQKLEIISNNTRA